MSQEERATASIGEPSPDDPAPAGPIRSEGAGPAGETGPAGAADPSGMTGPAGAAGVDSAPDSGSGAADRAGTGDARSRLGSLTVRSAAPGDLEAAPTTLTTGARHRATGGTVPDAGSGDDRAAGSAAVPDRATGAGGRRRRRRGAKVDEPEPTGWDRFAPAEERPPGRIRRVFGALGRFAGHEWTVASVAGLVLAVIMTWPTLRYPTATIPQDVYDPLLQTWQVAWGGHALLTDPLHLWDSNTFFPEHGTLAYSDSLLGYAPLGMIGSGPVAALVRYNVLYVLAYALAFVGAYALCRQLGARRPAAAMAGAAFAYAPWRLAHGGHLNILSTGGIALALAMLARGHGFSLRRGAAGGYRRERVRWGWALGGWAVAAWQITLGFGLGLPFAYLLGVLVLVILVVWVVRRRFPLRLMLANLGGIVLFGLTCVYMGVPYLRAVAAHPYARRGAAELDWFSPPWQGYFIAPEQSWLWGDAHAHARSSLPFQPEMTLLVGLVLLAFALLGLFVSVWSRKARIAMAAGVALTVVLGMGTRFPGGGRYTYLLLHDHLPAWDAIRTPGRLVVWTTLLLALLAAGAVSALAVRADEVALSRGRNPRRLGPALRVLLAVPLILVLVEGANRTPHPVVPTEPHALHDIAGPVLILPTDQLTDQRYMYWSTDGFPKLVNGGSGFQPKKQDQIRKAAASFPDQRSVTYLRQQGIRTVVVLRDGLSGTPYQNAITKSPAGLRITFRDTGTAVVFTLH